MRATSVKQLHAALCSAPLGIQCHSANVLQDEENPLKNL